jgi:hypothetical protein
MSRATIKAGDRAVALLCAWGVVFLGIMAFNQLWIKHHSVQDYIALGQTWSFRLIAFPAAALFVLACPIGVALAIRGRRHTSVRSAAVIALLAYVAAVLTSWLPGPFQSASRLLWRFLYWMPMAAIAVVFFLGIAWLVERRSALAMSERGAKKIRAPG